MDDDDFQLCDLTKDQLEQIVQEELIPERYVIYQPLMEAQVIEMNISRLFNDLFVEFKEFKELNKFVFQLSKFIGFCIFLRPRK